MKTLKYKLLALVISPAILFAQEKEKRVNRTFDVDSNTELRIENQFGRIHVDTWDKSEVEVEVLIRAELRNPERTQAFMDRIEIEISESSTLIALETNYGGSMNTRRGESFSVDYSISMPEVNPLTVENKFGDIYVGDLAGDLNVELQHGNMRGDDLTGRSEIEVAFGKANIKELGETELRIKYSDINIDNALNVDLRQQFSDVEIDLLNDIKIRSKYGSVELGTINSIKGSVEFTDFEIDEVVQLVDLEMEYVGGFSIDNVKQGFEKIRLDAEYTTMNVRFEGEVNGEFEGVFRYADLNNRGDELDLNYVVKDMHKSEYRGKLGKGGDSSVWVESSYGDLRLSIGN